MSAARPVAAIGVSFAAGMAGGLVFAFGSALAGLDAVTASIDRAHDGVGLGDAAIVGWFAGNLAILVHHVVPAIAWR